MHPHVVGPEATPPPQFTTASFEVTFLERFTAPEQVLPCQHYYMERGEQTQPEKRLLTAMLVDAYRCYTLFMRSRVPEEMEAHREAVEWFFGEPERDYPFSFESVCAFLQLSPDAVRRTLRAFAPEEDAPVRMPRKRVRRKREEMPVVASAM